MEYLSVIFEHAFLLVPFVLLLEAYSFYRIYRNSRELLPEEIDATLIYSEQAGGRLDCFNLTHPFVRISCYHDFLVIRYMNKKMILRRGDVINIEKKGFVSNGLSFKHNRDDLPVEICIWPKRREKLVNAIQQSLDLPDEVIEYKKKPD